jgi:quercetin dioxygenase-like cupin family protein
MGRVVERSKDREGVTAVLLLFFYFYNEQKLQVMATAGQIITNTATGEKLKWLQTAKDTNGALLQMELQVAPKGFMPVRHIHIDQTETFEIKSGTFKLECDGEVRYLKAGEKFTIGKGKPHQWWNDSDSEELLVVVSIEPANNFEVMMEQIFGYCSANGELDFLQIMAMAKKYNMVIAGPPVVVQKIMHVVVGPVARLLGRKEYYPEYSRQ